VLFRARQYEQSLARFERALEIDPNYVPALSRASDACIALGRFDEAKMYISRLTPLNKGFANRQTALLYAGTGRVSEARAILTSVEQQSVAGVDAAYVFAALGDREAALDRLERMVRDGNVLPFVLRDPRFDAIASLPRFDALLRSLNLQP
jgi:tetratricopeptide (TPR) repeat protein